MGLTRGSRWAIALGCAALMLAFTAAPSTARAASRSTSRVSLTYGRAQGAGYSGTPSISADGRFVAFASLASTLVAGDTNHTWDVFVRDRLDGTTTRVSVSSTGVEGDQASSPDSDPSISADGRFVAFASDATNLVTGDNNDARDVFVYEMATHTTTRVSLDDSFGMQGNGPSDTPSISGDGRFVAFASDATNLVSGDTNAYSDVFRRDRTEGKTSRASVGTADAQGDDWSGEPSISGDGRFVAFSSDASNLAVGDLNHTGDVFVRDLDPGGETTPVSVGPSDAWGDLQSASPSISDDGAHVAFISWATNLTAQDANEAVDVFVRDLATGETSCASALPSGATAGGDSWAPSISTDGALVAFVSDATDLVSPDSNEESDVFLRDRATGAISLVSVSSSGQPGDTRSLSPAISSDGLSVAFESDATNLVAGDTNGWTDIFVSEVPRVPAVGPPHAPSTMSRLKSYTVYGYLRPWHASGSYPLRIYKYRWVSGKWKSYGYVKAKAADYRGYTKCSVKLRLQYKGRWRLRARSLTDTGHVSTWSTGYDYVTVK